ncbi:MAG: fatty-acyl-CoA synthase [Candidatus Binatota bacterium]|nr:fatty-acyl-CoA synthase [Candidatus Binatota bacterium]
MSTLDELGRGWGRARALVEAGILGGTIEGAARLWRNLLVGDVHPSTLWSLNAANLPRTIAIVDGEGQRTWRELERRIHRVANALLALGVERGDAVAVMLPNSAEWIECFAACGLVGASAVFVSYRSTADELDYLLRDSGARVLVFHRDCAQAVREGTAALPPAMRLEVDAGKRSEFASYEALVGRASPVAPPRSTRGATSRTVLYTSGTTGRPKGAVREIARTGIGSFLDFLRVIPLRRSDRHLVAAPLYHATGSGFALLHASLGSTLVLLRTFDPRVFLRTVHEHRITTTAVVPTMLRSILSLPPDERERYDLSSLRVVVSTGSALPPALKEDARALLGDVVYDLYGATEMGWVAVATPDDVRSRPETVGRIVPGTDVVLLSDDRQPVPPGQVGELFARSAFTIEGYHGNEAATLASRWGDYFGVGDLAVLDADGYLTLVDRKADVVISGGANVYPAEVERVLSAHPAVREAAVVGRPDEHWGEALVAFLVPAAQDRPVDDALIEHCRRHLSGYKVPRIFRWIDELPRNPTGKVLKKELRARAAA